MDYATCKAKWLKQLTEEEKFKQLMHQKMLMQHKKKKKRK